MPPTIADHLMADPRFKDLEQKIIAKMLQSQDLNEAFEHYKEFGMLLPNWKFIFPVNNADKPGILANATFSHGAAVRSLFAATHVHVWDQDTFLETMKTGSARLPLDYSIGLDAQALSYLAPFLKDESLSRIPPDFIEVFNFIAQDNVNVDPIPYCLENIPRMTDRAHIDEVFESLLAYHRLRTIDATHLNNTGKIRSKLSDNEIVAAAQVQVASMIDECGNPRFLSPLLFRHSVIYALLLKITSIQINSPKQGLKRKLTTLLQFMDEDLGVVYQRELLIANRYFHQGQKFPFFNTIQGNRNGKKMLKDLRSMAWDMLHVRNLEGAMTSKTHKDVRYFLPAILTFDKRYIDVLEAYPLKGFAYNELSGRIYQHYPSDTFGENTSNFEDELYSRFFNGNAIEARRARAEGTSDKKRIDNIAGLIENLEKEFLVVTNAI
ncbi:hypothetical protein [Undibacterium sp. TJN19]|uniref:hypothetical protein n=1 Tax=Undibacterium sp. TJN19 TaxID=3413055 RepID=UPI003BF0391F